MKLNNITRLLAVLALTAGLPSCSDDDAPATPLETTQGENGKATYNTLSFEWDEVKGAVQYGYELYDPNELLVVRSVTSDTGITITDLKPATEYTLRVWSYAAIGSDSSTSQPFELKASTAALKAIGQPTLTCTAQGGKYVVTWKSVSNATAYDYMLNDASGATVESGSVTSRTLTFSGLKLGTYTLYVKATSTKGGYESEGEYSSIDFTVEDTALWRAEGTYWSELLGESWTATIVCYGDDNYTIEGWYGVEGYDIEFHMDYITDPEDTFQLTGDYDYDNSSYTYIVPTGRKDVPDVYVYPWWNYSLFSGNKAGGSVMLCVYSDFKGDYVTDTFTWKGDVGSPADDFVGTWNVALSGLSAINDDWDFVAFDQSYTIEITKVDDITIAMPALYFKDVVMNVEIDMAAGTLTAKPIPGLEEWFTLAGAESETSPIVGRINEDGSFEFTSWTAWFDGFPYIDNAVAKYSR